MENKVSKRTDQLRDFLKKHSISLDLEWLDEATTHDSYAALNPEKATNERMETLGDAVINLLATDWIYDQIPDATETLITQLRSEIVRNDVLGKIAKDLGLEHITLSGKGAVINEKQLADSFEAIFGALFKQSGYNACHTPFLQFFTPTLDQIRDNGYQPNLIGKNQNNPKNYLQEFLAHHCFPSPKIDLIHESGPPHLKKFVSQYSVEIAGEKFIATGEAASKKDSEKHAAGNLLRKLKLKFS